MPCFSWLPWNARINNLVVVILLALLLVRVFSPFRLFLRIISQILKQIVEGALLMTQVQGPIRLTSHTCKLDTHMPSRLKHLHSTEWKRYYCAIWIPQICELTSSSQCWLYASSRLSPKIIKLYWSSQSRQLRLLESCVYMLYIQFESQSRYFQVARCDQLGTKLLVSRRAAMCTHYWSFEQPELTWICICIYMYGQYGLRSSLPISIASLPVMTVQWCSKYHSSSIHWLEV